MAITNKLYPPIIKGALPAFYKEQMTGTSTTVINIKIPFNMNKMVGAGSVDAIFLRLKTVQTNEVKYCGYTYNFDLQKGIAYFSFNEDPEKTLIPGVFYKAQIAYWQRITENEEPEVLNAGYFSTVGIIKCITKPTVAIAGLNSTAINLYNTRFLGTYEQDPENGDINERVYSYCFTITDIDDNIYLTSGTQLHNTNNDINNWSSEDEFLVNKDLKAGQIYYLKYSITTSNGLEITSPTYYLVADNSIDMENQIKVLPTLNYDEGYIEIGFKGPAKDYVDLNLHQYIYTPEGLCSGLFLLSRASIQDDYMVWYEIARFHLDNVKPSSHIERDFTIEQGVTYKYRLQQYNLNGVYSNPIYSEEIYADFEDMFLYDGVRQLKVRFNPKVSSFKVDIPEQKIETIGSKYPYIFRNGNVYYHEFPISGLISYQLDEAKLFLNEDEIYDGNVLETNLDYVYDGYTLSDDKKYLIDTNGNQIPVSLYKKYGINRTIQSTFNYDNSSSVRIDKDLTSENLMSERYFKLAVLAWLTNGEIKLFRSPGEGNYLVRLLNTSLTPNDTLGRMLHTFNTTAYEIADLTYENLLKYQLLSINTPENNLIHYTSNTFTSNGVIYDSTTGGVLYKFEVNDCTPGDTFIVTFTDNTTETIVIGTTGSYSFSSDKQISSITFIAVDGAPTYPHIISAEVYETQQTYFDLIDGVNSYTILARTYCGNNADLLNTINENALPLDTINQRIGTRIEAYKVKVENIELMRVWAREIIPLYQVGLDQYATTPFGVGYPINELVNMSTEDQEIISRFAIFKVYIPDTEIIDVAHSLTPNESAIDKQYNQLYPDWVFSYYYDYLNNQQYIDKPNTYFAINKEANNYSYVDIAKRREMVLYNLGDIPVLYLGNGLIAELTMRIQVVNYSLERTNTSVAAAKQVYLNAKNNLITYYENNISSNASAQQTYQDYLNNVRLFDQKKAERDELIDTIHILESLTFTDDALNLAQADNALTAKNSIQTYVTTFTEAWQDQQENLPANVTDINTSNWTAIDIDNDAFETVLQDCLAQRKESFDIALENLRNSIPTIEGLDILFDNAFWMQSEAEIVDSLIQSNDPSVLLSLNQLYNLLSSVDSEENPFNIDWFTENDIPVNETWDLEDMATVLSELNTVSRTNELPMTLPADINDENYKGTIINILVEQQELADEITDINLEITDKQNELRQVEQQFTNNTDIQRYLQLGTEINTLQSEIIQLQNQNNDIDSLIAGLMAQEPTESNQSAIQYLNLLKASNNSSIINKQQTITLKQQERDSLQANYITSLDAINTINSELDTLVAEKTQLEQDYSNTETNLNAAIDQWNITWAILTNYMRLLTQVNSLRALVAENGNLTDQINLYQATYNQLYALNNSLYNQAYADVAQIALTAQAFEEFSNLLEVWSARKDALTNELGQYIDDFGDEQTFDEYINDMGESIVTLWAKIKNEVLPPENYEGQMQNYIEQMHLAWNRFMSELTNAYMALEERYLV